MRNSSDVSSKNWPHVLIIGAGFAGLETARSLAKSKVTITLIDRHNYHLFQPLLYQIATAALSPAQIAQPVRSILRKQKNCRVVLDEVTDIDIEKKLVKCTNNDFHYDFLVVATGSTHDYFGHKEWASVAPGLKSIDDATHIRRRILQAFEQAENSANNELSQALMTFVIVGAGPTGVEMAGAIAELAKHTLKKEFRTIDSSSARIILAEAGPRVLAGFPEKLSHFAKEDLEKLGVEVRTSEPVVDCQENQVTIGEEIIPCHTIIWAAGVKASAASKWLKAAADRAGRVLVNPDFSLPSNSEVFVIGDTASLIDANNHIVPGLAPAAMQAGKYVASVIRSKINHIKTPAPFVYKDKGAMATIGRGKAIALIRGYEFRGFMAWCLWGLIHLISLIGFKNRLIVALDWFWSYCTYHRGVRLITTAEDRGQIY